ncbi:single-stranded DNA-binding protein [Apilactobacillus kunkeei]|uniref:single-stranded DNA-binding protein n=1 Tax=Apilactobacillus kunkeei TaxID=148814 RepID=UPI00200B96CD|nr:single-stranded DNA-binding protein [Apilactobacillus kunkeei]MCK8619675.1 single-stranded DNA-binding protein [Apilactobacillus kunkeei]
MINRTVLTGRLTDDTDLRYTQSGHAVGNFRLAVNRRFKNEQGQSEADFISCVIWNKSAKNFANFTHKGSLVGIEGRIQTRNYENQNGQKVYITEVVVEQFALLEPRQDNQAKQTQQNNMSPFDNPSDQVDITDDDLPF